VSNTAQIADSCSCRVRVDTLWLFFIGSESCWFYVSFFRLSQSLDFPFKAHYLRPFSCAPVAQLDRVLDYESSGRWFESIRVRQFFSRKSCSCDQLFRFRRFAASVLIPTSFTRFYSSSNFDLPLKSLLAMNISRPIGHGKTNQSRTLVFSGFYDVCFFGKRVARH